MPKNELKMYARNNKNDSMLSGNIFFLPKVWNYLTEIWFASNILELVSELNILVNSLTLF